MAQAKPEEMLREAVARHQAGDLARAEALYRAVLRTCQQDANALHLLGVALRQRGALEEALAHLDRAVALRPDNPLFLANRGAALADAGRLAEAVADLSRAAAGRPGDATTLRNLGQAMAALGNARAAIDPLSRAVAAAPDAPEPRLALAHALREAGEAKAAVEAARAALARAPAGSEIERESRFLLAALGAAPPPDRAPADYVRALFDRYAPRFDADLEGRLGYRTPALLAALIERSGTAPARALRVLDLGCGTGLSGVALAPFAARLEGLDLSPRMLEEAARRGLYAALHEADLEAFTRSHPAAWDLIAAADVLNYIGDLAPAFAGIAASLVPGGIAAFSIETGEGGGYALGEGLRYRHDPTHVAALAGSAGLNEIARDSVVLREERGTPVQGTLFLCRRITP